MYYVFMVFIRDLRLTCAITIESRDHWRNKKFWKKKRWNWCL